MKATLVTSGISKTYKQSRWFSLAGDVAVAAVREVSLSIGEGRNLGLIGESGSGKSTLARCLACLERPDAGQIWLDGRNLLALDPREFRQARRQIQLVFQGSAASLNPRFSTLEIVSEPLAITGYPNQRAQYEQALALMESVGLPRECAGRKPSEFSGGERQRMAIARALAASPKVVVLDESLTGLDLPVQAQIVKLLLDLQKSRPVSYLLISHDLRLAAHFADDLAVMKDGYIVEQGPVQHVVRHPRHPHTRLLLAAVSTLRPDLPM